MKEPKTAALILAGGSSSRFRASRVSAGKTRSESQESLQTFASLPRREEDKLLFPLLGLPGLPGREKPLIQVTLEAFLAAEQIDFILLVVPEEKYAFYQEFLKTLSTIISSTKKPIHLTTGGASRYASTKKGIAYLLSLKALSNLDDLSDQEDSLELEKELNPELELLELLELVAIHDGARPLIPPHVIDELVTHAAKHGSAALAHRVTDTLHRANEEKKLEATISREYLWAMETPQVFSITAWQDASQEYEKKVKGNSPSHQPQLTDDVSLFLATGQTVPLLENHLPNPKITYQKDLHWVE